MRTLCTYNASGRASFQIGELSVSRQGMGQGDGQLTPPRADGGEGPDRKRESAAMAHDQAAGAVLPA